MGYSGSNLKASVQFSIELIAAVITYGKDKWIESVIACGKVLISLECVKRKYISDYVYTNTLGKLSLPYNIRLTKFKNLS
jgi:hypothetical protein